MVTQSNPEFLPTLQADDFLPSMKRWTTLGTVLLVGVFAGTAGLATTVTYNTTVQAIATIRPLGDLSIVQSVTAGTLSRIPVRENQRVQRGDIIAELAVTSRDRLQALQTRQAQLFLYLQQYHTQLAQVDADFQHQITEIARRVNLSLPAPTTLQSSATLAEVSEVALGKLSLVAPAEATQFSQQRDRLLQQRTALEQQIRYDQTTLQQVEAELNQQVIQAPVSGTILKLVPHNPGQTVRPGDIVAQIVPEDVPLIVKARVAAPDISQVAIGQGVVLRISAYPYPDYGTLNGTVREISPDVLTVGDAATGIVQAFYEVSIQPDRPYLTQDNRQFPLQPGMEVRADIISRQETVLRSLLRRLRLWSDL